MAESGISADEVKGSGRGGRISKQDVDRTLQARGDTRLPRTEITEITPPPNREPEPFEPPAPAGRSPTDAARERVVPMSPLRRTSRAGWSRRSTTRRSSRRSTRST